MFQRSQDAWCCAYKHPKQSSILLSLVLPTMTQIRYFSNTGLFHLMLYFQGSCWMNRFLVDGLEGGVVLNSPQDQPIYRLLTRIVKKTYINNKNNKSWFSNRNNININIWQQQLRDFYKNFNISPASIYQNTYRKVTNVCTSLFGTLEALSNSLEAVQNLPCCCRSFPLFSTFVVIQDDITD